MRKDGDINWTERESSLKHHVRSNVKHKTKENAPGQTEVQVKSIDVITAPEKNYFTFKWRILKKLRLAQLAPKLWWRLCNTAIRENVCGLVTYCRANRYNW